MIRALWQIWAVSSSILSPFGPCNITYELHSSVGKGDGMHFYMDNNNLFNNLHIPQLNISCAWFLYVLYLYNGEIEVGPDSRQVPAK